MPLVSAALEAVAVERDGGRGCPDDIPGLPMFDVDEIQSAEIEVEDDVSRGRGGALYLKPESDSFFAERAHSEPVVDDHGRLRYLRGRYADLPSFAWCLAFTSENPSNSWHSATRASWMEGLRFLFLDRDEHRVLVVARRTGEKWAGLWSGEAAVLAEASAAIRGFARRVGLHPPRPTREPSRARIVARAARCLAHRAVAAARLREVCRRAALRGHRNRRRVAS